MQYTFTHKQYTERHNELEKSAGRVSYPGICLTTEEKARKNLSQDSRRVPAGTMKIHKHTIRIHRHNNKNTYIAVLNRNTTIYTQSDNYIMRLILF